MYCDYKTIDVNKYKCEIQSDYKTIHVNYTYIHIYRLQKWRTYYAFN